MTNRLNLTPAIYFCEIRIMQVKRDLRKARRHLLWLRTKQFFQNMPASIVPTRAAAPASVAKQ